MYLSQVWEQDHVSNLQNYLHCFRKVLFSPLSLLSSLQKLVLSSILIYSLSLSVCPSLYSQFICSSDLFIHPFLLVVLSFHPSPSFLSHCLEALLIHLYPVSPMTLFESSRTNSSGSVESQTSSFIFQSITCIIVVCCFLIKQQQK